MTRRRAAVVVGGVVVALVVVGAGVAGYALLQGGGSTPTAALGPPHFVDETDAAGVAHTYDGATTFFTGGGVAILDCDADGRPDMYFAGGANPAALYRNDSPVGGALRFTPVSSPVTDLPGVTGAYPLDVDGDGNVDLAVLRVGENVMLRGLGGCRFERANEAWGIDGGAGWTTAFSATWEGTNALPTLAFGDYLALDATGAPTQGCGPSALVRPDASGARYAPAIPLTPGYCTLSILFSDWDGSGRRDLRVTNDRHYYTDGEDQLWRVAPGEAPRLYTAADGWVALQIMGMGIAGHDLTGDGYPEYFLTSQGDDKLQALTVGPAQPTYRDIALKRGVTAARPSSGGDVLPSTSWHPEFQDVNDDGFVDLLVTKGNVSAEPDYAARDPSDLFLGQPDGTFVEGAEAAGIVDFDRGRGAALADFNLDGRLDLVEAFLGAPAKLWRNVGSGDAANPAPMGNWLAVRLAQPAPNRDAIGAWIEVKVGDATLRREITVGGGHIGGQIGPAHFGLGPSSEAKVRVRWPDGEQGPWIPVAANQSVTIERGSTEARPWQPPAN
jgi:enediyne biosynthesis protein E4